MSNSAFCRSFRRKGSNSVSDAQDVSDPAVMVAFPVEGDEDGAALVAWTTTPWTLPSNLALCVNGDFTYVKVSAFCHVLRRTTQFGNLG